MGRAILISIVALAGASALATGAQPAAETHIRCELKPQAVNPMDTATSWARQYILAVPARSSQVKDVPAGLPKDSAYFLLDVAGRKIPLILAHGQNSAMAVLYVDTNGDGRLSDERGYKREAAKAGGSNWDKFGPVTVQFGSDERKTRVELGFMWLASNYVGVHPPNLQKGEFRLAGNSYQVAVIDGDLDGAYGSLFSMPPSGVSRPNGDYLMIDLNHDGKSPSWTYFQQSELLPLGRFVRLAGSYYSVDVAADGTVLELKKTEPELGTLDLGGANVQLKLWSDAITQDLAGSAKPWQLPAGTYCGVAVRLNLTDSTGAKWTFSNTRDTGALRDLRIRANETTTVKLGAPFQIQTSAQRSGQTVSLGVLLKGQAGEWYSLAVTKNGTRVARPRFQIVGENGKVLESGQFEYG